MPTSKPKATKKHPEQRNLANEPANRDVDTEEKTTTSFVYTAGHFFMRITAPALDKVLEMEDPEKRRKKLAKRVKARPDAEEIPHGAKKSEVDLIVAKAEHTNPRGLT